MLESMWFFPTVRSLHPRAALRPAQADRGRLRSRETQHLGHAEGLQRLWAARESPGVAGSPLEFHGDILYKYWLMDDHGMYIANNMTGVGPENGGYAFHFMAILKRIKSENDDSSVGHGHSGSITHTHAGKLLTKHLAPFVASSKNCTWLRSNAMICHVYSCKIKTSLFWLWFATLLHVKSNWCGFYALNDGAWPFLEPAAGHICSKFQSQEIHTPSHESLPQHALPHESLPEGFYQFLSVSQNISTRKGFNRHQCPFAGTITTASPVDPSGHSSRTLTMWFLRAMPLPCRPHKNCAAGSLGTDWWPPWPGEGSGWGIQISY